MRKNRLSRPLRAPLARLLLVLALVGAGGPVVAQEAAGAPEARPAARISAAAVAAAETAEAVAPLDLLEEIDIPYETFTLDNGLTVIVHEDRKAPIVAVNVWYHVGSKNEKPGRTGFAHLFEHLMFNGSENYDDDYFVPLERLGATDLNGTTNTDRTNYFQNVPTSALDVVLWLESDRMGHLLGAIDQARLDEQRGVVQNEKRQGENQPYGKAWNLIAENTFPAGHPYSWPVIGHMEDLDAAELEDVHQWFETYYGAANAVIVLAGDIDGETARQKVEHFFGDIEAGPPVPRPRSWVPRMIGTKRLQFEDRVPQARLWKVWNVPEWGTEESDRLQVVARILGQGRASRLYKRLVLEEEIATNVAAYLPSREIAGQFIVDVTLRPGEDLGAAERAVDEELARFISEGPSQDEVERAVTQLRASFVRGMERIGGFGGKSDILAEHQVYGGSPDYYKRRWEQVLSADPADFQALGREWLSDGVFILEAHPYPEYRAAREGADRSELPQADRPPEVSFPSPERATLSNGLEILLVERRAVPVVDIRLLVNSGYAADQFARPGTASLTMAMLDEGTRTRSGVELAEELERLGATLNAGANLDIATVSMSALADQLDASVDLFADVVRNPTFPEDDFARERRQRLAQIQREKVTPVPMALRVFPRLLYGDDHAYGNPLTGSGTEASVSALSREDLARFHETWFRPNNATLIVVGAVSMDELMPKLEARLGDWEAADVPEKNLAQVERRPGGTIYIVDRPGSEQSILFAGHVAPPKANPDELAIESLNDLLGGTFTSRINMNLREEKGWSYGAFSLLFDAEGQRPFIAYAPVQTDRTAESMAELLAELRQVRRERPPTQDELQKVRDVQVLTLPGRWETSGAIAGTLTEMVRFGLDEEWYDTLDERLQALTVQDLARIAERLIHPDGLVWVVVGDRRRIEPSIRELGLGEIRLIDADGQPMERAGS